MINTWSKFIYGTTVTPSNAYGDFTEGSTPYVATINSSPFTLTELIAAAQAALNAVGGQTYTITLNRTTGLVTVSAAGNFKIPLLTGPNNAVSFWPTLGFTQGTDLTGTNTYTGASQAGKTYYPQFLLQSYCGPNEYQQAISPMVNRTMTGRTELIRFGVDQFIEMDLQFITNSKMDGVVIKNDPNGLANAETFLQDITSKSRFEFWPDLTSSATIYKVVCESMPSYKDGSAYKLKERFADGLPGIFDTGLITLRVVT